MQRAIYLKRINVKKYVKNVPFIADHKKRLKQFAVLLP